MAFPIAEGATFEQAKAAFSSDTPPEGPPPIDFENISELSVLEPGAAQVTTINLKAGKYAFVCFLADETVEGNPPHFKEGMFQEVTVT